MSTSTTSLDADPFETAWKRVWEQLTDKEKKLFTQHSTIEAVYEETEKIQSKQGASRKLRNTRKIGPYVEGLRQYCDAIDVFVGARQDILSLIWGPIRLILQISSSFIGAYDKLLEIFHEIGSALPQFQKIKAILDSGGNCEGRNFFSLFYGEIIEFHFEILRFFRNLRWQNFFLTLWPRCQETFRVILQNIKNHEALIERELKLVFIEEARAERDEAIRARKEERELRERKLLDVYLNSANYQEKIRQIEEDHCPETGRWISQDSRFLTWSDTSEKRKILWFTGMPGAGKTYLCYSVLLHLERKTSASSPAHLLYAFINYNDPSSNTKFAVIKSLLHQLCQSNPSLIPVVLSEYERTRGRFQKPGEFIEELLKSCIASTEPTYILLDGLDECEEAQRKLLLKTIFDLNNTCKNLFVLLSSRKERDIEDILGDSCETIAVKEKNVVDIRLYVKLRLDELCNLLKGEELKWKRNIQGLRDPIVRQANGMFIYARILLAHMYLRARSSPVEDVLEEARNLPGGLTEIYGRILDRICKELLSSQQADVKRIFSWLICAMRPLRVVEVEHALKVRGGNKSIAEGRGIRDLFALCGPIVEKKGEYLTFVHFSAREFLVTAESSIYVSETKAQREVALTSLSYLGFHCFDENLEDTEIDALLENGEYVLLEYTRSHWLHHVQQTASGGLKNIGALASLIKTFIDARWRQPSQRHDRPKISSLGSVEPEFESLFAELDPVTIDRLKILAVQEKYQKFMIGLAKEEFESPILGFVSQQISRRLEGLATSRCTTQAHTNCASLHHFYGLLFRCPFISCIRHWHGFETTVQRNKHVAKHSRPFKCPITDCQFKNIGFTTQQELERHNTILHKRHELMYEVHASWEGMDVKACTRILNGAAKTNDLTLLGSMLSLFELKKFHIIRKDLLRQAVRGGAVESFEAILENFHKGTDSSLSSKSFVDYAIRIHQESMVKYLIGKNQDSLKGSRYLCRAVEVGNLSAAKLLLASGRVDPEERDSKWKTPLQLAIQGGGESIELVELLIENGADLKGGRYLCSAVEAGNLSAAKLLLACGRVDPEERDSKGKTPLQLAIQGGGESIELVKLLIESGADKDVNSLTSQSPLCLAILGQKNDVVKLLLGYGVALNGPPLFLAIRRKQVEIVNLLLGAGFDATAKDEDESSALHLAIGQAYIMTLLLDRGVPVDDKNLYGATALHIAAEDGDEASVRLLLQRSANKEALDSHSKTALHLAVLNENLLIAELLLSADGKRCIDKKDCDGHTALYLAALSGQTPLVQLLLISGADSEVRANDGYTPLLRSSSNGHEEITTLLLDYGTDKEAKENKGFTALHLAIQFGRLKIIRILLDKGANIEAPVKGGFTPLYIAVGTGYSPCVKLLLEKGVDTDVKEEEGACTALYLASCEDKFTIVESLLDYNADTEARQREGYTPLHIASIRGYMEIVCLLASKGADREAKDQNGFTPLLLASEYGRADTVRVMLTFGFNANARSNTGETAIHRAAWGFHTISERGQDYFDIFEALRGAVDVFHKNDSGETAFDLGLQDILSNNS